MRSLLPRSFPRAVLLLCSLLAAGRAGAEGPAPLALQGLDPVLLIEGREVEGDPLLSVVHDGLLYRFDSDRTRRVFVDDPDAHSVQFGGSCARMGPGVEGDPELFAVYQSRLYVFGTEVCLDTFLEHPDRYVPPPPEPLEASSAEVREARGLLEKAASFLSGKPLRKLEGYHLVGEERLGARSTAFELWLSLDGAVRRKSLMSGQVVVESWDGSRGGVDGPAGIGPLPAWSRLELLEQSATFDTLTVLHGLDFGKLSARLEASAEPGPTRWVLVAPSEASGPVALEIDRHSGRVAALRFRGRGPGGRAGWITRRFDDFRETGDLFLPFRRADTFEDQEEPFRVVTLESADVDRVAPERFAIDRRDR